MGTVARIGIASGKRVPLEGLLGEAMSPNLDALSLKMLGAFGVARIGERLTAGEPLERREIEILLLETPLSVLVKLLGLSGALRRTPVAPVPLVFLPLARELRSRPELRHGRCDSIDLVERTIEVVEHLPDGEAEVWLDTLGELWFDPIVLRILEAIRNHRPSFRIVGPSCIELEVATARSNGEVGALYGALAEVGIQRLGFSGASRLRGLAKSAGLGCGWSTDLSTHTSGTSIAEELLAVRAAAKVSGSIPSWMPYSSWRTLFASNPTDVLELFLQGCVLRAEIPLLRVLAVGALVLPSEVTRRVSAPFISTTALEIASWFGATDLGVRAGDAVTAQQLGLPRYEIVPPVARRT